MPTGIYTIQGKKSGPTTTIMCGVHGDELSGIYACDALKKVQIDTGIVYIIYANSHAIDQGVRLVDKNMNRCFTDDIAGDSYEEQRVQEIMPFLQKSDILLDIHNTINDSTQPFLISEHVEYNKLFAVPIVLSGLDDLHPGGSDGYMNQIGKIGLCLECGYKNDTRGTQFAIDSVLNLLKYTGNISGTPTIYTDAKPIHAESIYMADTEQFSFDHIYGDFDEVKQGEIIGVCNDISVIADKDCVIIFPNNSKNNLSEQFVIGVKK